MTPSVVVFDIGGVLIDWQPHLAWTDEFTSRSDVEAFMDRVGFRERNARADAGARFEDLAAEIEDPGDRALLGSYVARYARTVQDRIPGTWEIVSDLRAGGTPLHAITNWSAETWPAGVGVHPELEAIFDAVVVSGREGVAKPERAIFELLCARAGVEPSDCVFIDDGLHNVEGASAAGMSALHFTGADRLRQDLSDMGLL